MAMFRWPTLDPLGGLQLMQRELERMTGRRWGASGEGRTIGGGVYPPVNVLNGPDDIQVECELAGVKREDLDISITGETLVIQGTKFTGTDEDVRYQRRERGCGGFTRTIILPDKVAADRIEAVLEAGILTICLPKSEAARPKQIQVK